VDSRRGRFRIPTRSIAEGARHPKTETRLPDARLVCPARRAPAVLGRKGEPASAKHTMVPFRTQRVLRCYTRPRRLARAHGVAIRIVRILAPLPDVSVHLEEAKGVGLELVDRPQLAQIISSQEVGEIGRDPIAERIPRGCSRAASDLPLGLRRKPKPYVLAEAPSVLP